MLGTMGKILNGWIWDPQGSIIPMDPQESTIPMDEDAIFYNIYTHLT